MKNEEVSIKINDLTVKISKRPTFSQVLTISISGLVIIISLFTFIMTQLMSAQSEKISAETKLVIVSELNRYTEKNEIKWCNREESIIQKVLARLGLK